MLLPNIPGVVSVVMWVWIHPEQKHTSTVFLIDARNGAPDSYFSSAAAGSHWTHLHVNGAGTALAWDSLALGEWTHVRLTAAAPFQDDINLFSRVTDNDPRCV